MAMVLKDTFFAHIGSPSADAFGNLGAAVLVSLSVAQLMLHKGIVVKTLHTAGASTASRVGPVIISRRLYGLLIARRASLHSDHVLGLADLL